MNQQKEKYVRLGRVKETWIAVRGRGRSKNTMEEVSGAFIWACILPAMSRQAIEFNVQVRGIPRLRSMSEVELEEDRYIWL